MECFNGLVRREVPGLTIHRHAKLATVPRGFNQAGNARGQRVLNGPSPETVLQQRLVATPARAKTR